jgi:uncharacterized protein (TIGR02265 family)
MGGGGATAAAPLVGGRYELETVLGTGGAGEVWRARHVTLGSHVAIKFLHTSLAEHAPTRERFLTEARVAAQLETRYAVRVFDFGIADDGRPYLVMDLLHGETLGQRLKRVGRLSPYLAVHFLSLAARALSRAHALHIVHRDFKPDNVVLVPEEDGHLESVKVLDFGVAKLVRELATDDAPPTSEPMSTEAISESLTRPGSMLGTPRYMAPEQIVGVADLDLRADVWALGVVAFECLTGEAPFQGKGLVELFANIQCGIHPRASALVPELPETFDAWFDRACAAHPLDRFASATLAATELASALGEARGPTADRGSEPPTEPRPSSHPTVVRETRHDERSPSGIVTPYREESYRAPDWDAPLHVQACLSAIPPRATLKGLFSAPLIAEARRKGIALAGARERYLPFADYPLVEHVRLLVEAARAFYPDRPLRLGLRTLGWHAYPSFIQSVVGRVLWASVDGVNKGVEVAAKAYTLSAPSLRVTCIESGPARAIVRLEGVPYFLDSTHVGVFEGVLRACGAQGTVLVRLLSPSSADFLLTWTLGHEAPARKP